MAKKYEKIADRISTWVSESEYGPGDRIPSIRNLSETLGVSITTVTSALRVLESRGIIQSQDRTGYFVSAHFEQFNGTVQTVGKSAVKAEYSARDHLKLNKMSALQLGSADPSDQYLPTRQIQRSLIRASRRASDSLSYSFPGNTAYLNAIARRMTNIGVVCKASDIIAMSGAQEALAVAIRAITNEGDRIAIGVPASPGTIQALKSLNRSIVEIPSEVDGRPSLEALEMAIVQSEIKAVCISATLSNPTGYSLSDSDKKKLLDIVCRREIPLIEDDVFGDLYFGARRPEPLKAFDETGSVIYCSSFSKTVSPGLRCGWIIPGKFYSEISDQKYFMNFSSPSVTQAAMANYLESGSHERYLRKIRKTYQDNLLKIRNLVLEQFPEGTSATSPVGGFVFWVSLPKGNDTTAVYHSAMNAGICFAPGQIFSSRGKFIHCLRVSGAQPFNKEFGKAVVNLANMFHA